MKKFVAVVISIAMLMSMSVAVMADFVSSPPAGGDKPVFPGFIVTPFSDIHNAPADVDVDEFKEAHNELKNADDLSDLADGVKDGSVVRDIYDVTVKGDDKDAAFADGAKELTLNIGIKDGAFQMIFRDENGWKLFDNYKDNGDGTITLTIDTLGVFAVLVVGEEDGGENPPQTSDPMLAIVAVMAVSALATVVVASKKRKA